PVRPRARARRGGAGRGGRGSGGARRLPSRLESEQQLFDDLLVAERGGLEEAVGAEQVVERGVERVPGPAAGLPGEAAGEPALVVRELRLERLLPARGDERQPEELRAEADDEADAGLAGVEQDGDRGARSFELRFAHE